MPKLNILFRHVTYERGRLFTSTNPQKSGRLFTSANFQKSGHLFTCANFQKAAAPILKGVWKSGHLSSNAKFFSP